MKEVDNEVKGTYPYSSCPAVSSTSRSATSSSITHCFRYESVIRFSTQPEWHIPAPTLDCRVVFVNEVTLNELDCQSRLPDT